MAKKTIEGGEFGIDGCGGEALFQEGGFPFGGGMGVDGFAAEPAGELLEIAEIFFDGGRAMFFIDELTAIAVDHMRLQIMT